MSKEKTPIEELIEKLEVQANKRRDETVNETLKATIEFVKSFLPKEREAIEEAYIKGAAMGTPSKGIANQYYNDKYGK